MKSANNNNGGGGGRGSVVERLKKQAELKRKNAAAAASSTTGTGQEEVKSDEKAKSTTSSSSESPTSAASASASASLSDGKSDGAAAMAEVAKRAIMSIEGKKSCGDTGFAPTKKNLQMKKEEQMKKKAAEKGEDSNGKVLLKSPEAAVCGGGGGVNQNREDEKAGKYCCCLKTGEMRKNKRRLCRIMTELEAAIVIQHFWRSFNERIPTIKTLFEEIRKVMGVDDFNAVTLMLKYRRSSALREHLNIKNRVWRKSIINLFARISWYAHVAMVWSEEESKDVLAKCSDGTNHACVLGIKMREVKERFDSDGYLEMSGIPIEVVFVYALDAFVFMPRIEHMAECFWGLHDVPGSTYISEEWKRIVTNDKDGEYACDRMLLKAAEKLYNVFEKLSREVFRGDNDNDDGRAAFGGMRYNGYLVIRAKTMSISEFEKNDDGGHPNILMLSKAFMDALSECCLLYNSWMRCRRCLLEEIVVENIISVNSMANGYLAQKNAGQRPDPVFEVEAVILFCCCCCLV